MESTEVAVSDPAEGEVAGWIDGPVHGRLTAFLHQRARSICRGPLAGSAEDIAQTCSLRLVEKLSKLDRDLTSGLARLSRPTPASRDGEGQGSGHPRAEEGEARGAVEAMMAVERALARLGQWGLGRKGLGQRAGLERCLDLLRSGSVAEGVDALEGWLQEFRRMDGLDLFTRRYCEQNLKWASLDALPGIERNQADALEETGTQRRLDKMLGATQSGARAPEDRLAKSLDLRDAIDRLAPEKRTVVKLHLLGHRVPSIAGICNLNLRQAEARLRRARDELRLILTGRRS